MGLSATARRRWLGVLMLASAVGMLIAGETLLQGRLTNVGFLVYWLVCLLFTGSAIFIAFLDARATSRQTREEARELLENTLKKIETDAKAKPPGSGRKNRR